MTYVFLFIIFFAQIIYAKPGKGYVEKPISKNEQHKYIKKEQINNLLERLPKDVSLVIFKHPCQVEKIKWCSDNIHIATCADDNVVRIWNTQTGALIDGIGSATEIKDFSWAPDAKRIAITHHNNQAWVCDLTKVFEMEAVMESLSVEQFAFMDLFIADKPLEKLDEKQKTMLEALPDVVKDSLKSQLEFNIEGEQPNPLR